MYNINLAMKHIEILYLILTLNLYLIIKKYIVCGVILSREKNYLCKHKLIDFQIKSFI
jgi:hypothetical protein